MEGVTNSLAQLTGCSLAFSTSEWLVLVAKVTSKLSDKDGSIGPYAGLVAGSMETLLFFGCLGRSGSRLADDELETKPRY